MRQIKCRLFRSSQGESHKGPVNSLSMPTREANGLEGTFSGHSTTFVPSQQVLSGEGRDSNGQLLKFFEVAEVTSPRRCIFFLKNLLKVKSPGVPTQPSQKIL